MIGNRRRLVKWNRGVNAQWRRFRPALTAFPFSMAVWEHLGLQAGGNESPP